MREYGAVSPRFWIGATGKKLRGQPEAQIIALYLMTSPASHMIGIYSLALPTLCHETGLTSEGACKGLARLESAGFAYYDADEELVWVPEMARFQIGASLSGSDNRIVGVTRELENHRKSRFFNAFLDKYGTQYSLKITREESNPSKPLASPSEAPPKPRTRQDQDQDQDQTEGGEPENAPAPPPLTLLPQEPLTPLLAYLAHEFAQAKANGKLEAAWAQAYPGVDLLDAAKKARAWELSNPTLIRPQKRRFLSNWFSREQERTGSKSTMALSAQHGRAGPVVAHQRGVIAPDSREAHIAEAQAIAAAKAARQNP
jgi:hypothetical protein